MVSNFFSNKAKQTGGVGTIKFDDKLMDQTTSNIYGNFVLTPDTPIGADYTFLWAINYQDGATDADVKTRMNLEFEAGRNHIDSQISNPSTSKSTTLTLKRIRWDRFLDDHKNWKLSIGDKFSFNNNEGLFHYSTDVPESVKDDTKGVYSGFSQGFVGGNKDSSGDSANPVIGLSYNLHALHDTVNLGLGTELNKSTQKNDLMGHIYFNTLTKGFNLNYKSDTDAGNNYVGVNGYLSHRLGTVAAGVEFKDSSMNDMQISLETSEYHIGHTPITFGGALSSAHAKDKIDYELWTKLELPFLSELNVQVGVAQDGDVSSPAPAVLLKANFLL